MRMLALLLVLLYGSAGLAQTKTEILVPDLETATALAKVILKPIYGHKAVKGWRFTGQLEDGIWKIRGKAKLPPDKIATGGGVEVHIDARDARVSYIFLHL